ncbi:MAG: 4-alpha-glucanotransferase [Oscillospiraceae bacterium]|nr:4-alpha-glucanotransferase [Oscillospiraceae bacterium]
MRQCGILLHITSLPGKGGCGTMGKGARRFVQFLQASGQSAWQVLPLTPPAVCNSPYSSYSVFAGNPYLIDLPALVEEGLLPGEDLPALPDGKAEADFNWCEENQLPVLRKAFVYSGGALEAKINRFKLRNQFWLPDYAMFMSLKGAFSGKGYMDWPEQFRHRRADALEYAARELADETAFWEYVQFIFFRQWMSLKRYANTRGIRLIGDMPIYVDGDSSDVWANSQVFALDKDLRPEFVAGVPPDAFSEDGQLWGNPLYNWKYLKRTGYKWWAQRLRYAGVLYDAVRIDHFRALANYWAVPKGSKTAKSGSWVKGPGMGFIRAVRRAAPDLELIAEDLGLLDDRVRGLLRDSGLPGMKILQFAFSTEEESSYLPHNFIQNCVGYIGTHDNDTLQGWMKSSPPDQVDFARRYFGITDDSEAHLAFLRGLYATPAELVLAAMQDVLGLPAGARMNRPGIADGNWAWRLTDGQIDAQTAKKLRREAQTFCRIGNRK